MTHYESHIISTFLFVNFKINFNLLSWLELVENKFCISYAHTTKVRTVLRKRRSNVANSYLQTNKTGRFAKTET